MLRTASGLTLLGAISLGIAVVALPIITLFFAPEDFTQLAAFSSVAFILITVSARQKRF